MRRRMCREAERDDARFLFFFFCAKNTMDIINSVKLLIRKIYQITIHTKAVLAYFAPLTETAAAAAPSPVFFFST